VTGALTYGPMILNLAKLHLHILHKQDMITN